MIDGNTPEHELFDYFQDELLDLEHAGELITLELTPVHAWYLLASLQLALSHPSNTGPSTIAVNEIAKSLEAQLCNHRQAMSEVARRGWNHRHH
jgi:hypothetical protein